MIQIHTSQFDTEVDRTAGERVLTADISELQIEGFPDQFQLITSGGVKVMMENVEVDRLEDDISMVVYRPMSPAFKAVKVIIFND